MKQILAGPIVFVDDSDTDVLMARRCMQRSRLAERAFRSFPGGREFFAFLDEVEAGREPMPALVLLDINMPGMDGFEVLARTRERPGFLELPVFMMLTNSDDPRDIQRARETGATGYQVKPMEVAEYVAFFDSLADEVG